MRGLGDEYTLHSSYEQNYGRFIPEADTRDELPSVYLYMAR